MKWNNLAKLVCVKNTEETQQQHQLFAVKAWVALGLGHYRLLSQFMLWYHSVATQGKGKGSNSRLKLPPLKTSQLETTRRALLLMTSLLHPWAHVCIRATAHAWRSEDSCGSYLSLAVWVPGTECSFVGLETPMGAPILLTGEN